MHTKSKKSIIVRTIHESGWIGFGVDPQPTQLDRVYGKWTSSRLNIQVKLDISSHRLSGSKSLGDFRFEEQHNRNKTQT